MSKIKLTFAKEKLRLGSEMMGLLVPYDGGLEAEKNTCHDKSNQEKRKGRRWRDGHEKWTV
jgi:hypothetical protein